jgi:formylglycine-generating enzyme required for sulfatase activity/serine/threonine protein kinase
MTMSGDFILCCPECGARLDPAGCAAADQVQCTHCGKTFPLPAAAEQRPSGATTQTLAVEAVAAGMTANLALTVSPVGLRPLDTSFPQARAATGIAGKAAPAIPGYEILEELGRGGMGVVYKARQLSLNRIVALKMILAGPHADPQLLARFRVEAEAIARINHPNIVQIYEVGQHKDTPFLTLEFLEGGSLSRRLDATPQPARWCAEICEKLARAVHAAHQQGIIHRDLKPANVLLASSGSNSGRGTTVPKVSPMPDRGKAGEGGAQSPLARSDEPKLTDFGLAKRIESADGLTVTGQVVGTPSYMSPEQAEGNSRLLGPKSDVYSLGAILYEMLTGRPPLKGPTHLATLHQVKHDDPLAPRRLQPGIPRDIETICLKCLQKEPTKRYSSAEDLAEDLRRFLSNETIVARPAGSLERGVKWARRRPAVAALGVVSALTLTGFIGGGLWYNAQLDTALRTARTNEAVADKARKDAEDSLEARGRAYEALARERRRSPDEEKENDARDAERNRAQERFKKALVEGKALRLDLGGGVRLELLLISTGKFMMGSPDIEKDCGPDERRHEVTVSNPFYMGIYEVTQEQYEKVMGQNPSYFIEIRNPVDSVSWDDAQKFCQQLSASARRLVRLPTEAEWEYACRAGTTTRFHTGNDDSSLDPIGWWKGNSQSKTHPVGGKGPNDWGLYDMHGNVWEWCGDWYSEYPKTAVADGQGPATGLSRVVRGGSCYVTTGSCRSANRDSEPPGSRYSDLGFRVVVPAGPH